MADAFPPLRRLHPDATLERGPYKISLDYWRRQKTDKIVESLRPDPRDARYQEYLKVKPDGTVMQGNTRIKALEERNYDVNSLPRFPAD